MRVATALKSIAVIFLLVAIANTFTGCITYFLAPALASAVGGAIDAAVGGVVNSARDARIKRAYDKLRSASPLDSPAEDRLTRRTSTLDGGIPVDASPYLWRNDSFAVTEEGILRTESVLKNYTDGDKYRLYELDTVLTSNNADKKSYEMTIVTSTGKISDDKAQAFAAEMFGLRLWDIRRFKVKVLKKRVIDLQVFAVGSDFMQVTEPCYFQFDVEVEYQKAQVKKREEPNAAHFDVFNKVYRSDSAFEKVAACDIQTQIRKDANELSELKLQDMPLPIINVVRAVKIMQ